MTTEDKAASAEAPPPKKPPKTFLQTMQDHHYGYTADELTAALQQCISESERTGKPTKLTLTVDIKPVSKAQGRYNVLADVKTKLPAKEVEPAIMFVGPDGNLTTKDPKQPDLPGIRVVDGPRAAVRPQDEAQQAGGIRVAG
jgi:hypothetical protein